MVADIDGAKPQVISHVSRLIEKYTGQKPEEVLRRQERVEEAIRSMSKMGYGNTSIGL